MQGCRTDGDAEVKGHLRRPAIVIHDRPALFKPQRHNEAFSSRKSLISAGLTAKTVPALRDAAATRRAGTDSTFLTTQEHQNPVTANRTILCPLIRWRRTASDNLDVGEAGKRVNVAGETSVKDFFLNVTFVLAFAFTFVRGKLRAEETSSGRTRREPAQQRGERA